MMEIIVPGLIPKRKQWQSTEFLLDSICCAMEGFINNNPVPRFKQCAICFRHIYNKDLLGRRIRDYDNLELEALLDPVGTFVLTDDSGLLCDTFNKTEFGENDCTKISIMASEQLLKWLESREKHLKSISDF